MRKVFKRIRRLLTVRVALISVAVFIILGWVVDALNHIDTLDIDWNGARYTIDDNFFGVAIDAAMVTNGEWWANSDSPPRPLDFADPGLYRWTALLAPDWIRLGGTEADKLWLWQDNDRPTSAPILGKDLFSDYLNFTQSVGAKPFITTSTGPMTRENEAWQDHQLQRLLSWLPQDFDGALEFGNEPGAHWLIFGRQHQIRFDQLADEFNTAQAIVNSKGLELAGPANAFWPEIGEPLKQIVGSSKHFLRAGARPDIFTWHYYPTQSQRCGIKTEGADWGSLLDLETLQEFEKRSDIISRWLATYSPDSKQWLGETGPAQCGGKARLTDRFGASLWWLSHLGVAVTHGNKVVIRQSLMGGDYALLSYREGYTPNPDFWASLLWQQNMGPVGYRIPQANKKIRAIAHCHKSKPNTLSLVVINLLDHEVTINLPANTEGEFLDVTSLELTSRFVLVEGKLAETLDWSSADNLPWQPISSWRKMPAYSYRWINIAAGDAC